MLIFLNNRRHRDQFSLHIFKLIIELAGLLGKLISPALGFFNYVLLRI